MVLLLLRSSRFDDERVFVVHLTSRRPTIPPPPSSLRRMAESRVVAWRRRRARRRREHICVMCDICDTRDIFSLVWDEMSVQFFPIWKIARSLHYFLSLSLSLSCSRARVPKRVLSLLQKRLLKLPFLRALGTFCFAAASSKGPHHHLGES